jgi:hypothetical protein
LEIRLADASTVASTTGQLATRTVTSVEFQIIHACGNRPDDDRETPVTMNVGCDDTEFHARNAFGHPLPCNRGAGTATAIGWKLTESLRKCAAEDVNTDLIELAVHRADQPRSHRQLASRRRHGPRDIAVREVERFAEIVPTCGFSVVTAKAVPTARSSAIISKNVRLIAPPFTLEETARAYTRCACLHKGELFTWQEIRCQSSA